MKKNDIKRSNYPRKRKAEELKKDADYIDAPYGMDTSARTQCLECAEEHEQLADWLEELKERRKFDRWIPVSEKLPEIHVDVIVTDIETIGTYSAYYLGDGFWECDNGTYKNRIIAWMPFPEPYTEKSGEE